MRALRSTRATYGAAAAVMAAAIVAATVLSAGVAESQGPFIPGEPGDVIVLEQASVERGSICEVTRGGNLSVYPGNVGIIRSGLAVITDLFWEANVDDGRTYTIEADAPDLIVEVVLGEPVGGSPVGTSSAILGVHCRPPTTTTTTSTTTTTTTTTTPPPPPPSEPPPPQEPCPPDSLACTGPSHTAGLVALGAVTLIFGSLLTWAERRRSAHPTSR